MDIFRSLCVHSSPTPAIDRTSARIADEIEQVVAMIEAAGSLSDDAGAFAGAGQQLGRSGDRAGVRTIVESLVLATKDIESANARLESQLQQMRDQVSLLRDELDSMRTESLTDALTTLGNRKFFNLSLERAIAECRQAGAPLALLLADVDHFKAINDTYGHLVGDNVLRFIAATLKANIQPRDIGARYGGEEFAVILPRTELGHAVKLAEKLRHAMTRADAMGRGLNDEGVRLTISIGVAVLHDDSGAQSLVACADTCLYAAKRNGRDCVVSEADRRLLASIGR